MAHAQRRVIGAEADDDVTDAGPPPAEAPKADPKKPKKDDKKPATGDVLEDTAEEKAKREKADAARAAAEKAAEAAAEAEKQKKLDEQKRLLEEKKAADDKRKLENKDQRLSAAKKQRLLTRQAGDVAMGVALQPGEPTAGAVVEVRVELMQRLATPDPKLGNVAPVKGADLTATVVPAGAKKGVEGIRYVLHPLEAAGRYGFHTTPAKDGVYEVQVAGTAKDGARLSATFPLHVGVWPPPDFEDEEKNNLAAATSRKVN
jgi:hypothetical protein